ncbi:ABC transporter permease [Roseivirga misakiensis]|uniref:ABC3 transporter permease protein domain-containing protein n=1 Tax=Roseivirga misakiensis TaxID=1563681 RepID=A0A1E5T058_9BACT|nr:ABC transporter permease [Roseivirga misakiensis]OEK04768.1 hypothetical protein BFP71_15085 [Roseivirga misakiensis]
MIKNYVKIAFRNLARHKGYSFINITGLALGIACCLLILMYVKDEVTFDQYHSKSDVLYRLTSELEFGGSTMKMGATSEIEAKEFAERIPEIENFTRFSGTAAIVRKGEDFIRQFGVVFSDQGVFEMFDFEVLSGSLDGVLEELNRVVITKENAEKYFGRVDVAGEELTIRLQGQLEKYIIDAVINDIPTNSSLRLEFVFPWKKHEALQGPVTRPWGSIGSTSILQLRAGADPVAVAEKIKEVRERLNPGEDEAFARSVVNGLQPFTDIHLSKEFNSGSAGIKAANDPNSSYILSLIAIVILVLACINFANLTVARSLPRAKEIGVRKVLGALKKQLAFQFLSEAVYVSIISFVLGLIMAEFFLNGFGNLVNKEFAGNVMSDATLIGSCFLLVIFTALLAGAYPSFAISRFPIISSLNGKAKLAGKRYVSKGLVLLQFTMAGILVVGTIAMNLQIKHMLTVDLGYNDKNQVRVSLNGNGENGKLLKNELMSNPQIEQMALTKGYGSGSEFDLAGNKFFSLTSSAEDAYFDMIEVPLLAGRRLKDTGDDYGRTQDTLQNVLVNERFLEEIDVDLNEAIGQIVGDGGGTDRARIVGVIPDYKYASAKNNVMPMVFFSPGLNNDYQNLTIKYNPDYLSNIKSAVEEAWRKVDPYQPLSFAFIEEENKNTFAEEKRWKQVITYSTLLAIAISCLGLFGLAHLAAQQREKEIGVRKVLGASVSQLVFLLNSGFSKLVLLSFVFTIPIAYYLVESWLENFADQINIGVMLFLIPMIITLGIAVITISIQSFKTANSNPVNSLRNE